MKKVFFIKPEWPGVEGYDFNIDIEFDTKEDAEKYCKENSVEYYRLEESIPHRKLFFADVMARIPYGVKFRFELEDGKYETVSVSHDDECPSLNSLYSYWMGKGYYIPYLRPMSSMTEEEMKEYNDTVWDLDKQDVILKAKEYQENYLGKYQNSIYENPWIPWYHHIDWLNAHHFDYRGLIEKGLALEAPEGTYKTE